MDSIELKGLQGLRSLSELSSSPSQDRSYESESIAWISVDALAPGKYQPRTHFDDESLYELADSISRHGVLQPLIVRSNGSTYEIIAGERRWRAAKIAGIDSVPVISRSVDDDVALAFSLIENIQRDGLNPIEEAEAFSRFINEFDMTHMEVAKMVGRSRTAITNTLRLLALESNVRNFLSEGALEMGHARALLTLQPQDQLLLATKVVKGNMNVRQTEQLVQKWKESQLIPTDVSQINGEGVCIPDFQIKNWSNILSEKLSTEVKIKFNSRGKGKLIVELESPEMLDMLVKQLDTSK